MSISTLIFPTLLALSVAPAYAQCGHHHDGAMDHSGHQEGGPEVRATNTVCPVMGEAVSPGHDREVFVRGNYYLVCCGGCGPELAAHYDKYLDQDGMPLNAPHRDPRSAKERPAPAPDAHEEHRH